MGDMPAAAAFAVATTPTASGGNAMLENASGSSFVRENVRFGMPHALVVIVCIATAAVLSQLGMSIGQILGLIGGAGAIGATILVVVVTGGRARGRLDRLVRAYRDSSDS